MTRRPVVAAAVCWLLSVGPLLGLSLLAGDEPGIADLGTPASGWAWWAYAGALSAQAAALLWAWREPRGAFLAVVVLAVPAALLGPGPDTHLATPAVLVATYLFALSRPLRRTAATVVAGGATLVLADVLSTLTTPGSVVDALVVSVPYAVIVLGAPVLLGAVVRSRRDLRAAQLAEVEALKRERVALAQAAVARERTGMARELHDIAAHHLSGIAVMAAAVERLIDTDPESAKRSVHQVRTESRALLHNMRELVGLLRDDGLAETGEVGASTQVASLAAVASLVEQVRWRGMRIALTVLRPEPVDEEPWAPRGLGPLAEVAAYRMVQESLANATIHAPGADCSVVIDDREPATLTVTVENGPPEVGPLPSRRAGFGLAGMQERADLTSSVLRYGPTTEGGWRVSLTIPREPEGGGAE